MLSQTSFNNNKNVITTIIPYMTIMIKLIIVYHYTLLFQVVYSFGIHVPVPVPATTSIIVINQYQQQLQQQISNRNRVDDLSTSTTTIHPIVTRTKIKDTASLLSTFDNKESYNTRTTLSAFASATTSTTSPWLSPSWLLLSLLSSNNNNDNLFNDGTPTTMQINNNNKDDSFNNMQVSTIQTTTTTTTIPISPVLLKNEKIIKILDPMTIKLEKYGIVTLAGIKIPKQWPECFPYQSDHKIQQLLLLSSTSTTSSTIKNRNSDKYEPIQVLFIPTTTNNKKPPEVIIVRTRDHIVINHELVRQGYATVRNSWIQKMTTPDTGNTQSTNIRTTGSTTTTNNNKYIQEEFITKLINSEKEAKQNHLGLYQQCSINSDTSTKTTTAPQAEFELIDIIEIQYKYDGGRPVLRKQSIENDNNKNININIKNPGDVVGCFDFKYYEDSLKYYEYYYPMYGDVGKLNRNNDGIPCPKLPHTTTPELYRMKKPSTVFSTRTK